MIDEKIKEKLFANEQQLYVSYYSNCQNYLAGRAWTKLANCVLMHLISEEYSHDDFLNEIRNNGLDRYFSYTELLKDFESIDDVWKKLEDIWKFTCESDEYGRENVFEPDLFKENLINAGFVKYLLRFDMLDILDIIEVLDELHGFPETYCSSQDDSRILIVKQRIAKAFLDFDNNYDTF